MASASVIVPVRGPCSISTASKFCVRRLSDFESRRLSSNLFSFTRISSLRTLQEREPKSWRLAVQSPRPRRRVHAVTRSQAISSDKSVERTENSVKTDKVQELLIVGAGIAGLATAAAMEKIGVNSLVLEHSSALRTAGSALSLWRNAWHVLDVLGVGDKRRSMHSPITGMRMFNQQGDLLRGFEIDDLLEGKWMGVAQTRFTGHIAIRGLAIYPGGHPYGNVVRSYCGVGARTGLLPVSPNKFCWFLVYSKSSQVPK